MDSAECEWVIGHFTGDQAKSVKAHADAGIGYFIRNEMGRGMAYEVEAAFRRSTALPLPEYLQRATREQSKRLAGMLKVRQG
jgi:hypothetical protein